MKFEPIALYLCCTAIVCSLAVQSKLFHSERSDVDQSARIHAIVTRLAGVFSPDSQAASPLPAPNTPNLSKAETLALIDRAAAKYQVPAPFVSSIVAAESNFDCAAVSPKGAIGLMQLMPETAQQFGANPAVPAENIDAGTRYLRWLMQRYQRSRHAIRHVIAAYNAGPALVDQYRGVPPFRETHSYVARVLSFLKQFSGRRYASIVRAAAW
jgi:soluble lytic murein transglycosylase-like protein